jgi:hypothetical protein
VVTVHRSTLSKYKRDALEAVYDLKQTTTPDGILARQFANRILLLVDEITAITPIKMVTKDDLKKDVEG